ncbi:hypothetical protein [Candidatus Uabimicrobium sp. HlEnr_7]|uniref:hypothetical protein n=1 Tax=Candidatus Uabimicrobium helgolandensis TaxID=3095367 RepID=UPI0035591147
MDKNSHNEYLYFKCENGHENYIFKNPDKQDSLQKEQWVVNCQHCDWKSQPFFPQLFQHNSQGNFLLWIYTTKDVNAVHSVFNFEVQSSPQQIVKDFQQHQPSEQKPIQWPPIQECVSQEPIKKVNDNPTEKIQSKKRPATIKMPVMNRSMLEQEEQNPLEKVFEETPPPQKKIREQTVKMPVMNRSMLEKEEQNPLEEVFEEAPSPQKKTRQQTVKMPVMNRSMLEQKEEIEEEALEVEVQSPITERKIRSTRQKQENKTPDKHKETVKIQKSDILANKEKQPQAITSAGMQSSPNEVKDSVEDTIEFSIKELGLQEDVKKIKEHLPAQHNRIKLQQNYAAILILNFLWLLVLSSFAMLAYHFFDKQSKDITQALFSIKGEIANIEMPEFPEFPQIQIPVKNDEQKKWQNEYQKIYKEYRNAVRNLKKEKSTISEKEKSYRALLVTYREMQKKNSELQKDMQQIRDANYELQKQVITLKKQKKKTSSVPVKTKAPKTQVATLSSEESDFHFPLLSNNGKYMIFYRDQDAGRKRVRRYLKLAFLTSRGIGKEVTLFQTPVVKLKDREVPFIYDWNGDKRIVLLTRVKGVNRIHRLQLKVDENSMQASAKMREMVKTQYPITLGPPSISPNQHFFAYVYNRNNTTQIRINDMLTGKMLYSTSGGGDTLRVPVWSKDSRHLLFVANDLRGIVSWEFPRSKRVKKTEADIYGRYFSISPRGDQLVFLQNNATGKGNVDICAWNWQNLQDPIEKWVTNTRSTENCKVTWLDQHFAYIKKGGKDKIVLVDYKNYEQHEVFSNQGRIEWLSKSQKNDVLFSYREGLFSRPYTIQVKEE